MNLSSRVQDRVSPRCRDAKANTETSSGGELASTGSRAIAPTLGGYLMQEISTSLPLFVSAAVFTLGNALYYVFFRAVKPPEERREVDEAASTRR